MIDNKIINMSIEMLMSSTIPLIVEAHKGQRTNFVIFTSKFDTSISHLKRLNTSGVPDEIKLDRYEKIASSKMDLTLKFKLPTRIIQLTKFHLLEPYHTKYWGSVLDIDLQIAIAVSGFTPEEDELISGIHLANIKFLLYREQENMLSKEGDFYAET